jgi:hypothetical protein
VDQRPLRIQPHDVVLCDVKSVRSTWRTFPHSQRQTHSACLALRALRSNTTSLPKRWPTIEVAFLPAMQTPVAVTTSAK